MPVHHGSVIRKAAQTLASPNSSKKEKQKASQILNEHKKKEH